MSTNITKYEVDDEIDLSQLVATLWNGRIWIIFWTALGVALGALTILNTKPTFQADALIQLEESSGGLNLPINRSELQESDPLSATEIEILKSRKVLGSAVTKQNLDVRVVPDMLPFFGTFFSLDQFPFFDDIIPTRVVRSGESIKLDNLTVPPSLLNKNIEFIVLSSKDYKLVMPDGKIMTGVIAQPLASDDGKFSLTVSEINAPTERRFFLRQLDDGRAINALRNRFSVSELGPGSNVLELRVSGEDNQYNARAVNAIIQAYIDYKTENSATEVEANLAFIRNQLAHSEKDLYDAEAVLNAFLSEQAPVDLRSETQNVLDQIVLAEAELAGVQRREESFGPLLTPAHPLYQQLLVHRTRLEARLVDLRTQLRALPETQRQFANLAYEVELAQSIYRELSIRAQEVEALLARPIEKLRIIDSANPDPHPVPSKNSRVLGLSLILGAMVGAAAVLVRDWARIDVKNSSQLEHLGMSVFATINYSKDADKKGRRVGEMKILPLQDSASLTSEGIRSLRTSLHFQVLNAKSPSLCITSSHRNAGKSFLSVNLAAIVAQSGKRVCLVDADLRQGRLHQYFNMPLASPGLADVLAGEISYKNAIVRDSKKGLYFLPSGLYPSNPSELLMRPEFSRLVDWCAEHFDLTIFDTPPILAVTDPVIIGQSVGTTLFVARHGATLVDEIVAAQKIFDSAGLRISGAILNAFDPKKAGGKYEYGYRYKYKLKASDCIGKDQGGNEQENSRRSIEPAEPCKKLHDAMSP